MKRYIKKLAALMIVLALSFCCGCGISSGMKDGFYLAEMDAYSHGWKEYVYILVKNGKIVSAEFNAKNESGFIKAWDNEYMRNMLMVNGIYPNQYTREYVAQLIETQGKEEVDVITGASSSGGNFKKLVTAVIEQAKKGDSEVAIIPTAAEE